MTVQPAEQLITVFGAGGFIGRYVSEYLLKSGVRVRAAAREPRKAHFLQPLGQVGQIGFVRAEISDARSVAAAMEGANGAINLCGVMGGKVQATHVDGARNVAEAAAAVGAESLVHVSAIGADAQSESDYGRTKGEGEAAVRSAFGGATIVRPSLVFGPEDQLTNRFATLAKLPFLPMIAAERRFRPVYVRDLAQAIAKAALQPETFGGKTFEIGGPQDMSMRDIHMTILETTGQSPEIVEMPDMFAGLLARFGWLPGAPLTRDQWIMLQRDNLPAKGTQGIEAFGIKPTPMAAVAHEWLGRFHQGGRFSGRRINLTATN